MTRNALTAALLALITLGLVAQGASKVPGGARVATMANARN